MGVSSVTSFSFVEPNASLTLPGWYRLPLTMPSSTGPSLSRCHCDVGSVRTAWAIRAHCLNSLSQNGQSSRKLSNSSAETSASGLWNAAWYRFL
jgi:hypothetical protein